MSFNKDELTAEKMRRISDDHDQEVRHVNADNLLCEILLENGYEKTVREFRRMGKWYA